MLGHHNHIVQTMYFFKWGMFWLTLAPFGLIWGSLTLFDIICHTLSEIYSQLSASIEKPKCEEILLGQHNCFIQILF